MWRTNLIIVTLVVGVLGLYTLIANSIPQLESDVPQALALSADATPEQLAAAGEQIFNGAGGCTACHGLGTRAPNLLTDEGGQGTIGARCGNRKPGVACKDYLLEALTDPGAFVVSGYQAIMQDMRRTLPMDQVWAVIAYLESQGGTVDVTGDDVRAAQEQAGGSAGGGTGGGAATPATASVEPRAIIDANGCLGCHKLGAEGGPVGPPFDGVGRRLTKDQIRQSILEPNAVITSGYEPMAGTMPPIFGQTLTAAQLEALVNYLFGLR